MATIVENPNHRETLAQEVRDCLYHELFMPLVPRLYRHAVILTRGVHFTTAEDLVSDTMERILGNLHRYEPGTNPFAWAMTIQRRLFFNQQRRGTKIVPMAYYDLPVAGLSEEGTSRYERNEDDQPEGAEMTGPVTTIDLFGDSLLDSLSDPTWYAFSRLSVRHREVLYFLMEDLEYQEIAALLAVPLNTVRVQIFRARQSFEKHLAEFNAREFN